MINEIKKEFYRTPTYTAQLIHADHSGLAYSVNVVLGDTEDQFKTILVTFKIPYDDMGSAKF